MPDKTEDRRERRACQHARAFAGIVDAARAAPASFAEAIRLIGLMPSGEEMVRAWTEAMRATPGVEDVARNLKRLP